MARRIVGGWLLAILLAPYAGAGEPKFTPVDFRKDIEPILREHCQRCHGADKRKGGLLLTARKDALLAADSGKHAIVPGAAQHSELLRRVQTQDKDERMPPTGARLTAAEVSRLRAWIDAGAVWPERERATHWAYVPPVRPKLPHIKQTAWAKQPIDHFILARLDQAKLAPSAEAERERLIRRVYLDLIGLPPTPPQVDAFLKDGRPDAYERVVNRLLVSPRYGERWARQWLDLGRYADSNGFQRDGFRSIWPYRDWVIDAFNRDMPFDQFTIEQIAGDLLPNATVAQKIATGFNRCTTVNVEAGTDREENRVHGVIDRVNTTATVWLGTTMACAQCHNHKYDPFTMVDYYRLFAYFNNTEEETAQGEQTVREFIGPKLTLPMSREVEARRSALQAERAPIASEYERLREPAQAEWEKQCRADMKALDQLPPAIRKIVGQANGKRNKKQADQVADYFADQHAELKKLRARLQDLDRQLAECEPTTTLVMAERSAPRVTQVLKRGNFLDKGQAVQPGVPGGLHPLPADSPANRLGLARWLVDPKNPLVARVAVNRWWAEFFGHGLVATLEDFGTQSDAPTHPELLDWLAMEFMAPRSSGRTPTPHAWSMKHIHRLIVTSATYRQSSRVTPALLERDPGNKLYARGPRLRLDAETIRDNALAVSGLLAPKLGGPPVFPPQPPAIWKVTGVVDNTYRTSIGADRYRRGLYTIWRRSSPYPSMVAFDAPDRASCTVQRTRTNTPLQALTLLNDPVYVEAALALAKRMQTEGGSDAADRVRHGFRLCLARQPSAREIEVLTKIHEQALARYRADPAAARKLFPPIADTKLDPVPTAAWFQVATVLLNLDETITK